MKQVILITDGCSNVGINPVVAAAQAKAEQITVNVIGIVDREGEASHGETEITEIARAGGGMSRIVTMRQLARTVQMMTRQTIVGTIQQAVNKELRQLFGAEGIQGVPPEKRAQVAHVVDEMSETASLQVALLIDASASMKPKLAAVEEAIADLMLSLQSRKGVSEAAVFHFPGDGKSGEAAQMDVDWTRQLAKMTNMFYKLNMKGTTPTGPALLQVVRYMCEGRAVPSAAKERGGLLEDYVV